MVMTGVALLVLVGLGVMNEISKLRRAILSRADSLTSVSADALQVLRGNSSDLERLNDINEQLGQLERELPEKIAEQVLEPPHHIEPKGLLPEVQRMNEALCWIEKKMPRHEEVHHSLHQIESKLSQIDLKLFYLELFNTQLANIDGKLSDLAQTKEG